MKANKTSLVLLAHMVRLARPLRLAFKNDRGQVLPWVAFMMLLFLGMGAFVLDIGHAFICYRQLQAATDAAALAGAKEIYYSTSATTAAAFGAISGGQNTYSTLQGVSMVPGYPVTECLSTIANMGILCEGPNHANAIQVKEQAVIPTFFAQVLGIKQMTLSATSTAAKGSPVPLNVALIIDTTLSMNNYDSDCGNSQLGCALNGAQTLLAGLAPTIDPVSVFTFPNIQPPSTANQSNDTQCSPPQSTNPGFPGSTPNAPGLATSLPYSLPTVPSDPTTGYVVPAGYGSYQVTSYSKGYRSSNASTTPTATDPLVMTVGAPSVNGSPAVTGCLAPPNGAGIYGTYLAGVIYAAQASLASEQAAEVAANPTSAPTPVNIMIILSDGRFERFHRLRMGQSIFPDGHSPQQHRRLSIVCERLPARR
jgi:Flp pilus assembly protein TadG